jgi:hypothetical protein
MDFGYLKIQGQKRIYKTKYSATFIFHPSAQSSVNIQISVQCKPSCSQYFSTKYGDILLKQVYKNFV